jgi:periplasmic protein TonB
MRHIAFTVIVVTAAACGAHQKPAVSPAPPRPAASAIPPATPPPFYYDPDTGATVSGPGVVGPRAVYQPRAPYPPNALSDKVSGEVFMTVIVDVNGRVESVAVTKSVRKDLDDAAVAAVKGWRFDPAAKDGHPARARVVVTMGFYVK